VINLRIPELGEKYKTVFHISKEMVMEFCSFSKDDNPLHVNEEAARQYGFQSPVSHGAILLSEISRIIGTQLPGYGALWSDLEISFSSPVLWNETVDIEVEVIQRSEALGIIKLQIEVLKKAKKVLSGTAKVMCLKEIKRSFPMLDLSKRCALVTGGSKGLGLGITRELLEEGYYVVTLSRAESEEIKKLQEVYTGKLRHISCDLSHFEELKELILNVEQTFKPINIVIHAASPSPQKMNLGSRINETIDLYFNIYIKSLIQILEVCTPHMKQLKYGRVITIGTSYILGMPPLAMYPYIIGKEALWGLTKSLAVDVGRYGISANMISPSMMVTDMTSDISNAAKYAEAQKNPMSRFAELSEVAKTVTFLCGEGGSFINGTNMPITGGGI
jgi:3-oxoacyl-[acyl-carrier protein] reductase